MSILKNIQEVEVPEGKKLLIEGFDDSFTLEFVLEEDKTGNKKPRLKGRFGLVDIPTANKRIYPRKIMVRELTKLNEAIKGMKMLGELDHPGDGKTKLTRVSHVITNALVEDDGDINGSIDFIPGTINGNQALAIAKAGIKLGVSSRGFGTTVPDAKGNHVVQEDYQLVTWDLVADPANAGAYPEFVVEHKEGLDMTIDLKTLKKESPEVVEALTEEIKKEIDTEARSHAREALREEFENRLQESADEIREEAVKEARSELLSDPEVAGAATTMKEIAKVVAPYVLAENEAGLIGDLEKKLADAEKRLGEADDKLIEATKEAEELSELAKEAFYHLYLEKTLHGDDRREQVEGMLGDVTQFDSLDDLKERVDEIVEALSEEDEVREEYEAEIARLNAEKKQLAEELETSMTVSNQFAAKAYIERKLSNHPKATQLRKFLNEAEPDTKEDVDRLVEAFDDEFPESDEYKRIRKGLDDDGDERDSRRTLSEGQQRKAVGNVDNVLGVDMGALAKLSGIEG